MLTWAHDYGSIQECGATPALELLLEVICESLARYNDGLFFLGRNAFIEWRAFLHPLPAVVLHTLESQ